MWGDYVSGMAEDRTPDELASIWLEHRPQTLARLEAIRSFARALRGGAQVEERREAIRGEAHTLAGAAAIFGRSDATRIARRIEARLDDSAPLTAQDGEQLAALAEELGVALDRDGSIHSS